jgi:hypothetical protein
VPLFNVLEQLLGGRQPLVDPEQLDMHRVSIDPFTLKASRSTTTSANPITAI